MTDADDGWQQEKLAEELAEFIRSAEWEKPDVPLSIARKIIAAGWTKP